MNTRSASYRPRSGLSLTLAGVAVLILTMLPIIGPAAMFGPTHAHALAGEKAVSSQGAAGGPSLGVNPQNGCPPGFVIDFSGLPAGTVLGEQYASYGVHISAVANGEHPDAAIVFDSNATGSNDPDLEVGVGNISILARNVKDENADGLVDFPDENNFGGVQIFAFDQAVNVGSFLFIDKDHGSPDKAVAYDASNDVIKTVPIPVAGNGSVQTINVDAENVRRLEIVYRDSGGLTGIEINCPGVPTTTPTPSPTPTPRLLTDTTTPTPTLTPTVLEVVLPPELPIRLPATGGRTAVPLR
jgi:hypothetical protein